MRALHLLPLVALALSVLPGCEDEIQCVENCGGGGAGATSSSAATTASTTASTADSSSSTGQPQVWALPACASVKGLVPLTFSADAGATLAPFEAKFTGISYFFGLVASDAPNTLFADYAGGLFESTDAGCSFTLVHATELGPATLVRAPGGGVFGYLPNDVALYRYEPVQGFRHLPDLPEGIVGVGVDETDSLHVRVVTVRGRTYESKDAGETFVEYSPPLFVQEGGVYTAAVDPHDLNHVFLGVISDGGFITFDGGKTWKQVVGLGTPEGDDKANGFASVISPIDEDIVWVQGISLGKPAATPPVPDYRRVFLSEDGGLSFTPMVTETPDITLTNGVPMLADPADPKGLYFEFGTYYAGYGTDVFHLDATTKMVTKTHNPYDDMNVFVASPADPTFLYFGVTSSAIPD